MDLRGLSNHQLASEFVQWLVCQRYSRSTRAEYIRVLRRLLEFCGGRRFDTLSHIDIRRFLNGVSFRDLSPDVVRRHIFALRCFFDFLCLNDLVSEVAPRFIRPRPRKKRVPRALSEKNVRRLIATAGSPRNRAVVELFYATGCRLAELIAIKLEHVDFANRSIRVTGKGRKERRVFFGEHARKALLKYLNGRQAGYLFQSEMPIQNGSVGRGHVQWYGYWYDYRSTRRRPKRRAIPLGPRSLSRAEAWKRFKRLVPNPDIGHVRKEPLPLGRRAIREIFHAASFKAGLGNVTSRMMRHSFAAHLLDHGADVRRLQELLGHECLASTENYTSVAAMSAAQTYKNAHPRS